MLHVLLILRSRINAGLEINCKGRMEKNGFKKFLNLYCEITVCDDVVFMASCSICIAFITMFLQVLGKNSTHMFP